VLGLFQDFNELVHAQQPMVDQCKWVSFGEQRLLHVLLTFEPYSYPPVEQNVLVAEEETKSAVRELATVVSYLCSQCCL